MTRPGLAFKYAIWIALLVSLLVAASGVVHYRLARDELLSRLQALQQEKAANAARRIEGFVLDLREELGALVAHADTRAADAETTQRLEFVRVLRRVPAFAALTWVGADGLERLHVSRIALDRLRSGREHAADPVFQGAAGGQAQVGAPYFVNDSEPHVALAAPMPGGGALIAEVNLKFIWDIVASLSAPDADSVSVIARDGLLLAHPDLAQVLARTRVTPLTEVGSPSHGDRQPFGRALSGEPVFSAQAAISDLGWTVLVESPLHEFRKLLDATLHRTVWLLAVGLAIAIAGGWILARRMVRPLRVLQAGTERVAAGRFDEPLRIDSGDEIEELAARFNQMAAQLRASYESLEARVAERTRELAAAQQRSQELLVNILPARIADELARTGRVEAVRHESASVLFTDFAGFTQSAATMPPDVMVGELNEIFGAFDHIAATHGVERIKTIGDAYMAAAGVTVPCADHAIRCVDAALAMLDFVAQRNLQAAFKWHLRVGIHSGPVVSGVIGTGKFAFDVWGDTVNLASRLESAGKVGRINVSAYTFHLLQGRYVCTYRGKIEVKGKGGIDMYFISSRAESGPD